MNSSYQPAPTATPVVAQTVVIPAASIGWSNSAFKIVIGFITVILVVHGVGLLIGGISVNAALGFSVAALPYYIFGAALIAFGILLWKKKGFCCSATTNSGQVIGPSTLPRQTVLAPQTGYMVVGGQTPVYPTPPAPTGVPGGLVTTYTYTPNQPVPGQVQPPVSGQIQPPAYPYGAGGQAPAYPMDQKPPIGAPAPVPYVQNAPGPSSPYAPGFQGPPAVGPVPNLPEYQPQPAYAPDEKPPPYSSAKY